MLKDDKFKYEKIALYLLLFILFTELICFIFVCILQKTHTTLDLNYTVYKNQIEKFKNEFSTFDVVVE